MPAAPSRAAAPGAWGLGGFLGLLAAYLALHFALRVGLSDTVGTDDVAEAIFAQSLEWSYYPRQPPLYTWLVWGAFEVFGVGIASLTLVRYAAVAAAYLFLYLSARRILADARLAALSAFSLLLIYAVGWGVHVGFTNTVLLMAACAATFYAFLRVADGGGLGAYLGLGAAAGVGLLSKYGYLVFAVSLLVAALMQEGARRRLRDPRMALAAGVAAALVLPYLVFGFEGAGQFQAVFRGAMKEGGGAAYLPGVARGLASFVEAAVLFLSPLWLVLLFVFPRAVMPGALASGAGDVAAAEPGPGGERALPAQVGAVDARRLLEHFFIAAFAIVLVGILAAGVTYFKSRWMHPVLIFFPLYFFCRVKEAGATDRQLRLYALVLAGFVALVVAVRVAQAAIGPPLCSKCRFWMPYPELAEQIRAQGFARGTIVAADEHIAGNFRVAFPDSRVVSLTYDFYVPPLDEAAPAGQCLVLWHADSDAGVPANLAAFLAGRLGVSLSGAEATGVVAAEPHFRDGRVLRLGYVLRPGAGRCR